MKAQTIKNKSFNPYLKMKNNNYFMYTEIISNIKKLYTNVKSDHKSSILSLVTYPNLKKFLRNKGYIFTTTQFKNAIERRISQNFDLLSYKRYVPKSKKKLNEEEVKKITDYLEYYSRESSSRDINVKYLEYSKKFIYNKYISDNNKSITYNTFLKYCPKNYKKGKKRTDVCGICEIGKKLSNINIYKLSSNEKKDYLRNIDILNKHHKVVENQKSAYKHILNNLDNESCVLILDFKENFKLSHGGNEISCDFYNKRQVSCMGAALIFKSQN